MRDVDAIAPPLDPISANLTVAGDYSMDVSSLYERGDAYQGVEDYH